MAVSVDLSGGVSDVDASTTTVSDAIGISGGAGSDAILNVGELDIDSRATAPKVKNSFFKFKTLSFIIWVKLMILYRLSQ